MRLALLFCLLGLIHFVQIKAQEVNFRLVYIDTLPEASTTEDLIIGNSAAFREAFLHSKYALSAPRFQHTIYLRRTIQASCLREIENKVVLDSIAKTLSWHTTIKRGACDEINTRQIVIAVARPPIGYSIQFDTISATQLQEDVPSPVSELANNTVSCQLGRAAGEAFSPVPLVITSDRIFRQYYLSEALSCTSTIDFSSHLILGNIYGGDCHLQLAPHSYFDPITNTLILEVYNIWGGCRAGGRKSLAVVVPRPAEGFFKVVFQEIQVDSYQEYQEHLRGQQ